jgi:hypothetical protein
MAPSHVTRLARPIVSSIVVVSLLAAARAALAADPVFITHQPLTHALSSSGNDTISVLLSTAQPVTGVEVALVQIRSPQGESLPPDTVTLEPLPGTMGPAGSRLGVRIAEPSRFRNAGDYAITLRLTGLQNNTAQTQLLSLTVSVPPPALNVARHQNAVVRAYRWWPWLAATAEETLKFEETGGRSNVADLKVTAQDIYVKGTTELADASLEITGGTNGADGRGATLPAGGQREIHLKVSGLTRGGTMTTGVLVASPTLAGPISVPLAIEVSDRWPLPFIVIALGVLLGAWVRHLAQVARPRETARFRRSLLAGQVARWRDRSRDPQQIQELDAIDDTLRRADERLQLGDVPGATTLLDQAEAAIAQFRKGWEEKFRAVLTRMRETSAAIDDLGDRIPSGATADLAQLELARQSILSAQQAMSIFDVPAADRHVASARLVVDALAKLHPKSAARVGLAGARTGGIAMVIEPEPEDRVAGTDLILRIEDPGAMIAAGDQFDWDFGDGTRATTQVPNVRHRFLSAGGVRPRVDVVRAGAVVVSAVTMVDVLPRPIERLAEAQAESLRNIAATLTLVSLVLAILTAVGLLFLGKTFGTPQQYLEAFLWGFGVDSSVKTIADLLKKVG